jgi:Putative prokaryotic signal transducing protein
MIPAMSSDPEKERQRLARLYSGMIPEELEKVAANAVSLTDVAREALKAEIRRRGLAITLSESTGVDIVEERDLVMIRRFQSLTEALLARGSLDSSGIECFLTDDNMVRMDWFISNLLGWVKLLVNREDAESAIAILDEPTPELLDVEGVGEYQQPHCPECQSLDVNFEQLNRKVAYTTAWIGIPIPLHTTAWTCRSCGHRWQDRDPAEPEPSNQP